MYSASENETQRRFTKRLLDLKDISYRDRLVILDNADTME